MMLATCLLSIAALGAPATTPAERPALTLGQPTPLSQRAPLLPQWGLEVDLRYGLVGTGATRFIHDIRFAPLDWLELRTALNPLPSSLMLRLGWGDLHGPGSVVVDAGVQKLDLGIRFLPSEQQEVAGLVVANLAVGLAYDHAITRQGRVHAVGRLQQRLSNLDGLQQTVAMAALWGDLDIARYLGVSAGLGYGQLLAGELVEPTVNFAEIGRSGFSVLLDRDSDRSATVAAGLTYARTERFDIDVFATLRYWPEPATLFGAGLRWRL